LYGVVANEDTYQLVDNNSIEIIAVMSNRYLLEQDWSLQSETTGKLLLKVATIATKVF